MTRKEKKQKTIEKRNQIVKEIAEKVEAEWKNNHDFEKALKVGDEYINRLIRIGPQEKELILQAAYILHDRLVEYLEKNKENSGK